MKERVAVSDNYFERNSRWLRPIIAGLIFLIVPAIAAPFLEGVIPQVVPSLLAAFAFLVAGVFAVLTETLSARLLRVIAPLVAAGLILYAILN